MALQLEYTCTEAELKEAQQLHLQQQVGGGSKLVTAVALAGVLVLSVGVLILRFKTEIPAEDRYLFGWIFIVVFCLLIVFQRKTKGSEASAVRLEASPDGLTLSGDDWRNSMRWTSFSQLLESSALFVLVDSTGSMLYTVPKRVFSDQESLAWFRAQANQIRTGRSLVKDEPVIPAETPRGDGGTFLWRLQFRDYLDRFATSWGTKGILLVLVVIGGAAVLFAEPPPDAAHEPVGALLIMVPVMFASVTIVTLAIAFFSWMSERKHLQPQYIVFGVEGIEFSGGEQSGKQPWAAFKFYRESRRSFFIWNPKGMAWLMFSKRDFQSSEDLWSFRQMLEDNLVHSRWFFM